VVGVINSAISAFYYVGVVVQMYMRSPAEEEEAAINLGAPVVFTLTVAMIVTILLGVWPTPLVNLTSLGIFG
jgi:NADH-quinone oxidoreductase subunit N